MSGKTGGGLPLHAGVYYSNGEGYEIDGQTYPKGEPTYSYGALMGKPQPAHLGSQSNPPEKED